MKNSTYVSFLSPVLIHKPIANVLGLPESVILSIHRDTAKHYSRKGVYEMPDHYLTNAPGIDSIKVLRGYEEKLVQLGILIRHGDKFSSNINLDRLEELVMEEKICL